MPALQAAGKSTLFPVARERVHFFNADDRAAELNSGSYLNISPDIRGRVNREFEEFIASCIRRRESFAIETTLRTDITFRQARHAQSEGFEVFMRYVSLGDVEQNLERIRTRAAARGHSAPESVLRAVHSASLRNLPTALRELDQVVVYDNSRAGEAPWGVLLSRSGRVDYVVPEPPAWLVDAFKGTEYELPPAPGAG